jgi:hypothetical protein
VERKKERERKKKRHERRHTQLTRTDNKQEEETKDKARPQLWI